jgi:hypothetical protein
MYAATTPTLTIPSTRPSRKKTIGTSINGCLIFGAGALGFLVSRRASCCFSSSGIGLGLVMQVQRRADPNNSMDLSSSSPFSPLTLNNHAPTTSPYITLHYITLHYVIRLDVTIGMHRSLSEQHLPTPSIRTTRCPRRTARSRRTSRGHPDGEACDVRTVDRPELGQGDRGDVYASV